MSVKKISVILFLIILASFVYAENIFLDLNLTKDFYGQNEIFEGYLNISFESLPSNFKIEAFIDDVLEDYIIIKDLFVGTVIPASYKEKAKISEVVHNFDGKGEKIIAAIKIPDDATSVRNISFQITGINDPISPKIDIGNDQDIEYEYIGPLTGQFSNRISPGGLWDFITDDKITVAKNTILCQKIKFPVSNRFLLEAYTSGDEIDAFVYNPGVSLGTPIKQCKIPSATKAFNGCVVDFSVKEENDYYVCLKAQGNTELYLDTNNFTSTSYICNPGCKLLEDGVDYFITIKKGLFQRNLNSTETIYGFETELNDHLAKCDKECLILLKVFSESSGSVKLSSLNLVYNTKFGGSKTLTEFSEVDYTEEMLKLGKSIIVNLNKFKNLTTPKEPDEYALKIKLGDEKSSSEFEVAESPIAVINVHPFGILDDPLYFNSNGSKSPNGEIVYYRWNFGDGNISTEENPFHTYKEKGNFSVSLIIEDVYGLTSSISKLIEINSASKTASISISSAKRLIDISFENLNNATPAVREIANLIDFEKILASSKQNLTLRESQLNSTMSPTSHLSDIQKESKYREILEAVKDIKSKTPLTLKADILSYNNYLNLDDMPDVSKFYQDIESKEAYKAALLNYQNNVNVNVDAMSIDVVYLDGTKKSFGLIKKVITGQGEYVVDVISKNLVSSASDINSKTSGMEIIEEDPIVKWPFSTNIIYGILNDDILDADKEIKTIILPKKSDLIVTKVEGFQCGDGICQFDEDRISCPEDCRGFLGKRGTPWVLITILLIITLIGIYYFNYYKGKGDYKEVSEYLSVKFGSKRIFLKVEDKVKLKDYVEKALAKGYTKEEIENVLYKKGWTKKQVNLIFKELEKGEMREEGEKEGRFKKFNFLNIIHIKRKK